MAGAAALVAVLLGKATEKGAQAADGNSLVLGSTTNQATSQTILTRGAGTPGASNYALQVFGGTSHSGLYGNGTRYGVSGYTSDTTNSFSGVDGNAGFQGSQGYRTAGVHGTSVDYPGVIGDSNNASGVIGLQGNVAPPANTHAGVLGVSVNNAGVHGVSGLGGQGSGIGARGDSGSGYGLVGVSSHGIGAAGRSLGAGTGVYGQSASGVGVWARSDSYTALFAQSGTDAAVYGASGTSTGGWFTSNTIGVYATAPSPGLAARFDGNVLVNGIITQTGGAMASAAAHPDGTQRRLYGVESPESWCEDFGRDRLVNGRARVRLDPDFNALVRGDNYHVFLTEEGDQGGLYVEDLGPNAFTVRARSASASGPFSYRVVAKRRDARGQRLERVERPDALPRPMAPTPPVAPPLPPLPPLPANPHPAPPPERHPG
jgi:hypothetical protein